MVEMEQYLHMVKLDQEKLILYLDNKWFLKFDYRNNIILKVKLKSKFSKFKKF